MDAADKGACRHRNRRRTSSDRVLGCIAPLNALRIRPWPVWTGYLLIAVAALTAWLLAAFVSKMWTRLAMFVLIVAAYLFIVKLSYDEASIIILGIPPVL